MRLLAHKQNGFLERYQQRRACLSLPEKTMRAPLQLHCLGGARERAWGREEGRENPVHLGRSTLLARGLLGISKTLASDATSSPSRGSPASHCDVLTTQESISSRGVGGLQVTHTEETSVPTLLFCTVPNNSGWLREKPPRSPARIFLPFTLHAVQGRTGPGGRHGEDPQSCTPYHTHLESLSQTNLGMSEPPGLVESARKTLPG